MRLSTASVFVVHLLTALVLSGEARLGSFDRVGLSRVDVNLPIRSQRRILQDQAVWTEGNDVGAEVKEVKEKTSEPKVEDKGEWTQQPKKEEKIPPKEKVEKSEEKREEQWKPSEGLKEEKKEEQWRATDEVKEEKTKEQWKPADDAKEEKEKEQEQWKPSEEWKEEKKVEKSEPKSDEKKDEHWKPPEEGKKKSSVEKKEPKSGEGDSQWKSSGEWKEEKKVEKEEPKLDERKEEQWKPAAEWKEENKKEKDEMDKKSDEGKHERSEQWKEEKAKEIKEPKEEEKKEEERKEAEKKEEKKTGTEAASDTNEKERESRMKEKEKEPKVDQDEESNRREKKEERKEGAKTEEGKEDAKTEEKKDEPKLQEKEIIKAEDGSKEDTKKNKDKVPKDDVENFVGHVSTKDSQEEAPVLERKKEEDQVEDTKINAEGKPNDLAEQVEQKGEGNEKFEAATWEVKDSPEIEKQVSESDSKIENWSQQKDRGDRWKDQSKQDATQAVSETQDAGKQSDAEVGEATRVHEARAIVTDADEDYPDFLEELRNFPERFQKTAESVKDHIRYSGLDLNRYSTHSKELFNQANQQIQESFTPLLGKNYAPAIAYLVSYGLLLLPLALVMYFFERVRAIFSLQKVLFFVNIYLSAYFAALLAAAFILDSEPMAFFMKYSSSSYIFLQLLQAFGYLAYLLLNTVDLLTTCSAGRVAAKFSAAVQFLVVVAVGFHYYVTVFHRAMERKAPITGWRIYGLYSVSFFFLCLFARIERGKKQYTPVEQDDETDKKN